MQRQRIVPANIEEQMRNSYLDYSMSVIVSRALPDVRDGLKPVHRRVLYGMSELGLYFNRAYKKSARVVGEVLGKYHPHGDSAVYDTMVRLVQDFSMRYPLIDGQGNFGSIDGDSPAAMRYTEVRLHRMANEILRDLDKETVDFRPNFDETLQEPAVLPTVLPNLLCNGASGIAVGMATNIPPHNLSEVVDALVAKIDNPEIAVEELMRYIKGPDFPTAGIIFGSEGIREAYTTGRGKVIVRAKASVEHTRGNRERIVITELPYQVNKAGLITKIADLVRNRKIEGIIDINDESDRDGMRVVIEIKRDAQPKVVLNQLYKHTQMQTTFGIINLALVDGQPRIMNLNELLHHFITHRHEVILRRTRYELDKAEKRAHILEGYKIALDNIDEVVDTIKKSRNPETAQNNLMKRFGLTEIQAKAILDMRLQRLTGLERKKIEDEYREVLKTISRLKSILASEALQMQLIKDELLELKDRYGDDRRTEIVKDFTEFSIEDMIAEEDMVITITRDGYIKRFPVSGYRRQRRNTRGSAGAVAKGEDFVEHLFIASTHNYILFFTDKGKCYWLKVHEIPQVGKAGKGRAIVNMIQVERDEQVTTFINVKEFSADHYLTMATRNGLVKKTSLSAFSNPRRDGIYAIKINEGDRLIGVRMTDGTDDIFLATSHGMAIRFSENEVREMGRVAAGVKGITLSKDDYVIGMVAVKREGTLMAVSELAYGKRTDLRQYRVAHRGGKGIKTFKVSEKTGRLVSIKEVVDDDDLMLITNKAVILRIHVGNINITGRDTMGVRLMRLDSGTRVGDVARVAKSEENSLME
ncbi:DNA gyrase subunit A [Candidatus Saccharibacteria bacterium]|nr:DNA gyrase subunit A [Calditrichia bacterium]NIV72206.1 DNA gyrase subunit A [Calditrichia bacterium]NIV99125.1 DNA gyrase subunit A [Candidatus Saccharibacteria bacterium]